MSNLGRILLIEDDGAISRVVVDLLENAGYTCEVIAEGVSGLKRALSGEFSLILLDIGLPLLSGLDVCRQVKAVYPRLPIIILTAQGEESDVVAGIEVGADDYVQKPFRPRELLARIRARLREETRRLIDESGAVPAGTGPADLPLRSITIGEITVDPDRMRVLKRGEPLPLSAREYEVVLLLASNAGRPFTRNELLSLIWEFETEEYSVNVSVLLSRLRSKLEDDPEKPKYLLTVRGVGYRFVESVELEPT